MVIGPNGIEMKKEKVDGVLSWPQPKTVRDVRKFLGLANCKGDWSKAPGDSSVNYNLWNIVTTYLQEIPQRIR